MGRQSEPGLVLDGAGRARGRTGASANTDAGALDNRPPRRSTRPRDGDVGARFSIAVRP